MAVTGVALAQDPATALAPSRADSSANKVQDDRNQESKPADAPAPAADSDGRGQLVDTHA